MTKIPTEQRTETANGLNTVIRARRARKERDFMRATLPSGDYHQSQLDPRVTGVACGSGTNGRSRIKSETETGLVY